MQRLSEILKKRSQDKSPPMKKIVNERQYVIEQFVESINKERIGTRWKPVSWRQINGMVAHLKGFELNWFLCECKKAKSFGKYFFYKLKNKNGKSNK